jgi:hypothetical protein
MSSARTSRSRPHPGSRDLAAQRIGDADGAPADNPRPRDQYRLLQPEAVVAKGKVAIPEPKEINIYWARARKPWRHSTVANNILYCWLQYIIALEAV